MNRRQVSRTRIIIIAILTILTIGSWVGTEIYQSLTTDQVTPQVEKELTPLQTTFNLKALEEIEQKREIEIDFTRPIEEQFQVTIQPLQTEVTEDTQIQFTPDTDETLTPLTGLLPDSENPDEATDSGEPVDSP